VIELNYYQLDAMGSLKGNPRIFKRVLAMMQRYYLFVKFHYKPRIYITIHADDTKALVLLFRAFGYDTKITEIDAESFGRILNEITRIFKETENENILIYIANKIEKMRNSLDTYLTRRNDIINKKSKSNLMVIEIVNWSSLVLERRDPLESLVESFIRNGCLPLITNSDLKTIMIVKKYDTSIQSRLDFIIDTFEEFKDKIINEALKNNEYIDPYEILDGIIEEREMYLASKLNISAEKAFQKVRRQIIGTKEFSHILAETIIHNVALEVKNQIIFDAIIREY